MSYIFFLHQTTTVHLLRYRQPSIVLYLFSTSNHNVEGRHGRVSQLSYIFFLHHTTTPSLVGFAIWYCLISFFYIKPQHECPWCWYCQIVLYLFSTSNHNTGGAGLVGSLLSYIFFLHQTTTRSSRRRHPWNCLISFFYIKPQRKGQQYFINKIVLYLFSTSNHNRSGLAVGWRLIVLYLFSTSNHNVNEDMLDGHLLSYIFFLHQTTTVVNVMFVKYLLSYIFFLHQTTTAHPTTPVSSALSYIFFLHQTTTILISFMIL